MKKVTYIGPSPVSFINFPEDCERTCKGSIHFLPNQQKIISDSEYESIMKEADVKHFRVHKLPMDEKVVLGKRKGVANSENLRDETKAMQFDGNKLHIKAKKDSSKKVDKILKIKKDKKEIVKKKS